MSCYFAVSPSVFVSVTIQGLLAIFKSYGVRVLPARSISTDQAQTGLAELEVGKVAGSTISMLKVARFHEDLLAAGHTIVTAALSSPMMNPHRIRLYDAEQARWVTTGNFLADFCNWTLISDRECQHSAACDGSGLLNLGNPSKIQK